MIRLRWYRDVYTSNNWDVQAFERIRASSALTRQHLAFWNHVDIGKLCIVKNLLLLHINIYDLFNKICTNTSQWINNILLPKTLTNIIPSGFCSVCTSQLKDCPLCRADIISIKRQDTWPLNRPFRLGKASRKTHQNRVDQSQRKNKKKATKKNTKSKHLMHSNPRPYIPPLSIPIPNPTTYTEELMAFIASAYVGQPGTSRARYLSMLSSSSEPRSSSSEHRSVLSDPRSSSSTRPHSSTSKSSLSMSKSSPSPIDIIAELDRPSDCTLVLGPSDKRKNDSTLYMN